jgi:Beta-lactamase superfamily domain
MHVEWYGQSAFRLTDGSTTVFIDPFGDMTPMLDRGMRWDYPAIAGVEADLLLVTHEHVDHNRVEAVGGDPVTLRSTAGRLESPIGEALGIASEHDEVAGTKRGAPTLCSSSRSRDDGSRTWATSGSVRCATNSWRPRRCSDAHRRSETKAIV